MPQPLNVARKPAVEFALKARCFPSGYRNGRAVMEDEPLKRLLDRIENGRGAGWRVQGQAETKNRWHKSEVFSERLTAEEAAYGGFLCSFSTALPAAVRRRLLSLTG